MNYKVLLSNGNTIDLLEANMDVKAFTQTLNEQAVIFVNLGGAIVNKHLIQAITPYQTEEQVIE